MISMNDTMFAASRRASGLTAERAARITGVSRPTYNVRETQPGTWRLSELRALYAELDEVGRELLMRAVVREVAGGEQGGAR